MNILQANIKNPATLFIIKLYKEYINNIEIVGIQNSIYVSKY